MKHFNLRFIAFLLAFLTVFSLVSCTEQESVKEDESTPVKTELQASSLTLPEGSAFSFRVFSAEESAFGIVSALPVSTNESLNKQISQAINDRILANKPVDGSATMLDVVNCKKVGDRYSFAFVAKYQAADASVSQKLIWLNADFAAGNLLTVSALVDAAYFERDLVSAYCKSYLNEHFSGAFDAEKAEALVIAAEKKEGFYLTADGLVIVLQDEVGAEDSLEIPVSNSALAVFERGNTPSKNPTTQYPSDYAPAKAGEKVVALTFDDGPSYSTTPKFLDYLEKNGYKVTFFVNGYNFSNLENPSAQAILKRAAEAGCEIGNHSYSHPDFCSITPEQRTYQLEHNAELIEQACGVYPNLFRAPGGNFPQGMKEAEDYFYIYWTADGEDWKYKNSSDVDAQALADRYLKLIKSGSIVLFHDVYPKSVDAAIIVMNTLKEQGYRFVTVSELLDLRGKTPDGSIYISQTGTRGYVGREKNG